jgi:PAS domain S-box-containing protein
MATATTALQRHLVVLSGPLATALLVGATTALARRGVSVPAPAALSLFTVLVATAAGGRGAGLVSAALAIAGAAVAMWLPGRLPAVAAADRARLAVVGVLAPATVVLVDRLRRPGAAASDEQAAHLHAWTSVAGALADSEARTRAILDTVLDAIITIDEQGCIESVNPAAERIFGYQAGELIGRNVSLLMPSPEREAHDQYLARWRATGERHIIGIGREVQGRRKDGTVFPLELVVNEVRLGDRRLFTGLARDISERQRAEAERAELLRREQAARAAAEAAAQRAHLLAEAGAALASAALDLTATLAALTRLLVPRLADWCVVDLLSNGELQLVAVAHVDPAKEDLVRRLRAAYPVDRQAERGLARVLRTGEPEFFPVIDPAWRAAAARDPEHLALMEALAARSSLAVPLITRGRTLGALTLVFAESGRRYGEADLALAGELAQRAALAIDNARLYQETQAALRVRDTFLSIASHELRTPVTSLRGFVQALQRHQQRGRLDPAHLASALPVIQRNADRLAGLIDDLLDVSRIQLGRLPLRLQPVDLVQLVRTVIEDHPAQFDRQHPLRLTAAVPVAPVLADPDRLAQVMTNLLDNAVTYSPDGGEVEVTVAADADGWRISVRDQGIGLAPGAGEAIFEPFTRQPGSVQQQPAGLGLGLYISRMIVEQHGGRIWIESAGPGCGATAQVWLPRSAQVAPPAAVPDG